MKSDKKTELQFGDAILNKPITHKLKINRFISIKLKFRPAKTSTIIEMSQLQNQLQDVNESENQIVELLGKGGNFGLFCRIVSSSLVNSTMKPVRKRVYNWMLKNYTTPETLLPLVSTAYLQTDPERFFFIMALTKGKNFLIKKNADATGEAKQ